MVKITKRALLGYTSESVELVALQMREKHTETCQTIQKKLDQLKKVNAELIMKLTELKTAYQEPEKDQDMAIKLLAAHYDATMKVQEAKDQSLQQLKEQEDVHQLVLERQKVVLSMVKTNLAGLLDED